MRHRCGQWAVRCTMHARCGEFSDGRRYANPATVININSVCGQRGCHRKVATQRGWGVVHTSNIWRRQAFDGLPPNCSTSLPANVMTTLVVLAQAIAHPFPRHRHRSVLTTPHSHASPARETQNEALRSPGAWLVLLLRRCRASLSIGRNCATHKCANCRSADGLYSE